MTKPGLFDCRRLHRAGAEIEIGDLSSTRVFLELLEIKSPRHESGALRNPVQAPSSKPNGAVTTSSR